MIHLGTELPQFANDFETLLHLDFVVSGYGAAMPLKLRAEMQS